MKKGVSLLLALVLCLTSYAAMAQTVIMGDKVKPESYVPGEFPENYRQMKVKESLDLKVYANPGGNSSANTSAVRATLSSGTVVELLKYDITGKWVRVLYNERNNAGWVYLESLEKLP